MLVARSAMDLSCPISAFISFTSALWPGIRVFEDSNSPSSMALDIGMWLSLLSKGLPLLFVIELGAGRFIGWSVALDFDDRGARVGGAAIRGLVTGLVFTSSNDSRGCAVIDTKLGKFLLFRGSA